jgi:hypothetical protein
MNGQFSIFDIHESDQLRPCEYRFKRYMGQMVQLYVTSGIVSGKIISIEPYYTIVESDDGIEWAGTPTNTSPLEG